MRFNFRIIAIDKLRLVNGAVFHMQKTNGFFAVFKREDALRTFRNKVNFASRQIGDIRFARRT